MSETRARCDHCFHYRLVTGEGIKEWDAEVEAEGWTIDRTTGPPVHYCPRCTAVVAAVVALSVVVGVAPG